MGAKASDRTILRLGNAISMRSRLYDRVGGVDGWSLGPVETDFNPITTGQMKTSSPPALLSISYI